jgi:hypothetical protein
VKNGSISTRAKDSHKFDLRTVQRTKRDNQKSTTPEPMPPFGAMKSSNWLLDLSCLETGNIEKKLKESA